MTQAQTVETPGPKLPEVVVTAKTPRRRRVSDEALPRIEPIPFRSRAWVGLLLFLGDVLTLEASLALGAGLRSLMNPWLGGALRRGQYGALAAGMVVLPLAYCISGLYPGYGVSVVQRLRRRVYTLLLLFAVLIFWDYMVVKSHTSRGVLLLTFAFALVLGPLVEATIRRVLIAMRCWGTPVVILGAGETGSLLTRVLAREPELGLVPIAAFDDDHAKWGQRLEGQVPILGPLTRSRVLSGRARMAMLAIPRLAGSRMAHLCARLPFHRVVLIPDLIGLSSLWVISRDLGGVVGLEVTKNLFSRWNWLLKRTMDYAIGVPLFVVSLPLMGVFAIWIKAVSAGPAFYRQARVGLGGRTIHVWKLRTMSPDADQLLQSCLDDDPDAREQWERFGKLRDDPRVLPGVGRVLRRTSLDELPQIWNVLRGEMSLVGPRPFPHYHLENFRPEFRTLRRSVLPGMTGLWQVSSRSDGDFRLQEVLDTYYIRNWSPWLDIYLLARTFGAVVMGRGAY